MTRRIATLAGTILILGFIAACDRVPVTQSQGYLRASQSKDYSRRERD